MPYFLHYILTPRFEAISVEDRHTPVQISRRGKNSTGNGREDSILHQRAKQNEIAGNATREPSVLSHAHVSAKLQVNNCGQCPLVKLDLRHDVFWIDLVRQDRLATN